MNIYFVSGHLNLTQKEFDEHYADKILDAIKSNSKIITSDSKGCDTFTQQFLVNNAVKPNNVVIYHMFDKPRVNIGNFPSVGGAKSDEERDSMMTRNSTHDIAWVRPESETKKLVEAEGKKYRIGRISGTEKNILRRININSSS